jgi:pimeloyl-ACP methyl ester carboxylesterase
MVFAHGLVYPDSAVVLPVINALRDSLGAKGFAVAYSSYSVNGWAVKDGEQRTHQLRGLFASRFGEPARTYIYGRSMGGLIAVLLAEKYADQYAGAFAECGVVAGPLIAWRYAFDLRRLFDYFYPGVVPGSALGVPPDWVPGPADATRATVAMTADMTGALAIAKIDQTPIQFATPAELRAGIVDVLTLHAFEVNDFMQRAHGRPPVSSSTFTSTGANGSALDPALLESINANTLHYDASPDAAVLIGHQEPTGDLRIPVTIFTTSRDPRLPPVLNELIYQSRVDAAGKSDLLLRRQVSRFGHCNFTAAERAKGFTDFVAWADSKGSTAP